MSEKPASGSSVVEPDALIAKGNNVGPVHVVDHDAHGHKSDPVNVDPPSGVHDDALIAKGN